MSNEPFCWRCSTSGSTRPQSRQSIHNFRRAYTALRLCTCTALASQGRQRAPADRSHPEVTDISRSQCFPHSYCGGKRERNKALSATTCLLPKLHPQLHLWFALVHKLILVSYNKHKYLQTRWSSSLATRRVSNPENGWYLWVGLMLHKTNAILVWWKWDVHVPYVLRLHI